MPQSWPNCYLHELYGLCVLYLNPYCSFSFFSLCRKWSMVLESGAGCVSTSLEMCKRVWLLDSAVNSLACAKPQEWQVSLKCFKIHFLHIVHAIVSLYLFTTVTVLLTVNYRTLLWSLSFRLYTCALIKWREV